MRGRMHKHNTSCVAMPWALLVALLGGCGDPSHSNVKVKSLHGWELGRAKSCMLFNGGSVVEGGKRGSDPKEMQCVDHKKEDIRRSANIWA